MNAEIKIVTDEENDMEKKYAPQEKYDRNNTVRYSLKLNKKTDADIIAAFDKQTSKQAFVKKAIRELLAKEKAEE
jgi:hypothetical protein